MLTSLRLKPSLEAHEVLGPEPPQHLDLLGLARAACLPLHAERFVLDVVPTNADAKPQPPTAEQVHLGRLLGDDPRLPLRPDQDAGRKPDALGDRCQKAERDEGLVEGISLIVKRHPAIPRLGSEDVVGHFDRGIAEVLGRLRPIADLRRVRPDIQRREEGVELHGGLQVVVDLGLYLTDVIILRHGCHP